MDPAKLAHQVLLRQLAVPPSVCLARVARRLLRIERTAPPALLVTTHQTEVLASRAHRTLTLSARLAHARRVLLASKVTTTTLQSASRALLVLSRTVMAPAFPAPLAVLPPPPEHTSALPVAVDLRLTHWVLTAFSVLLESSQATLVHATLARSSSTRPLALANARLALPDRKPM